MTKLLKPFCYSLALLSLALAPARFSHADPQEAVFELDPAQTHVGFTLGDVLHTVHGAFRLKSGTIRFTPTGAASGLVIVDATSGESGSEGRDSRMHREILESSRYTEITFTPLRVEGVIAPEGESQVKIDGILKLHGSEHNISFDARVRPAAGTLTGSTKLLVPYVSWGLKNPSNFLLRVSTKVDIDIQASGRFTGLARASTARQ